VRSAIALTCASRWPRARRCRFCGIDVAAHRIGRRPGEPFNTAAAANADSAFARFAPRFAEMETEETRMRTSIMTMWVISALAIGQASFAQPAPEPSGRTAPSTEPAAVSDAELDTFATIYVDLLETAAKFEAEMSSAQTEEQAQAVKQRVQTESVAKVAQHGWTPEKFNSVSEAINRTPGLADKAVKLIEEKS
jgi:hypothetical protein